MITISKRSLLLALVSVFTVFFIIPAQAADNADTVIPEIQSIDVAVTFLGTSLTAESNLKVKVHTNSITAWYTSYVEAFSRSVLEEPCAPVSIWGLNFLKSDGTARLVSRTQVSDGFIETWYGVKTITAFNDKPWCAGTYRFLQLGIYDEATSHRMSVSYRCIVNQNICNKSYDNSYIDFLNKELYVLTVDSNVWEAVPSVAKCPRYKPVISPGDRNDSFLACNQVIDPRKLDLNISQSQISAAKDKAAADKAAADKAAADKAAAKKLTITCTKGKAVKQVSGQFPKCPVGYKKK